jgi:hypothetical protein
MHGSQPERKLADRESGQFLDVAEVSSFLVAA